VQVHIDNMPAGPELDRAAMESLGFTIDQNDSHYVINHNGYWQPIPPVSRPSVNWLLASPSLLTILAEVTMQDIYMGGSSKEVRIGRMAVQLARHGSRLAMVDAMALVACRALCYIKGRRLLDLPVVDERILVSLGEIAGMASYSIIPGDEGPAAGATATCHDCGGAIIYDGEKWDHLSTNKPRHPARPRVEP
jgi:hypothetical protein